MVWFSIVTGIAGLISLILQVSDKFQERRNELAQLTMLLVGLTIGLFLNIALDVRVSFPIAATSKELVGLGLYGGSGMLVFVLFILAAVTSHAERRTMARNAAAAVSGFLIFLLIFFVDTFFKAP